MIYGRSPLGWVTAGSVAVADALFRIALTDFGLRQRLGASVGLFASAVALGACLFPLALWYYLAWIWGGATFALDDACALAAGLICVFGVGSVLALGTSEAPSWEGFVASSTGLALLVVAAAGLIPPGPRLEEPGLRLLAAGVTTMVYGLPLGGIPSLVLLGLRRFLDED
ncbi:MAG: hypothetical protein AB7N76_20360 [Planctomycetota bacterium]